MSTVTIVTLHVLTLVIVIMLACMAIGTDVHLVRLSGGYFGTTAIGTQHESIPAAKIRKMSFAVNGGTA